MSPAGVIRPILLAENSVNHRLPSSPVVMSKGPARSVGSGYSSILPAVLTRAIRPEVNSVNHR